MSKIAVLGAGSWGTALSIVLADNNHEVRLWSHRADQVSKINDTHLNEKYLNVNLPKNITAYSDIEAAVLNVDAILIVVPSSAIREVSKTINPLIKDDVLIVHATKGIEPETSKRISEILGEEITKVKSEDIVVLSGPSHAEEVGLRLPTTVTVASNNIKNAEDTQHLFFNENFRVYTSDDVIGVELGGALKNIIALGAGISDGLNFGDNAKAALITRGLAEITRLGVSLGAKQLSFIGLSGMGDLIVTSTSQHSRNWRAGNLIGKGHTLDSVLNEMGMVVEGVRTTKAAYLFSIQEQVEMPITHALYQILYNNADPKEIVEKLMTRDKKDELDSYNN